MGVIAYLERNIRKSKHNDVYVKPLEPLCNEFMRTADKGYFNYHMQKESRHLQTIHFISYPRYREYSIRFTKLDEKDEKAFTTYSDYLQDLNEIQVYGLQKLILAKSCQQSEELCSRFPNTINGLLELFNGYKRKGLLIY